MINKSDKRFVDHWLEQRSGPRWKYYLQFTFAWSVVSFLVIFFLAKLFTELWETGGKGIIILSLCAGFLATHITYMKSEKKYKKIINNEQAKVN